MKSANTKVRVEKLEIDDLDRFVEVIKLFEEVFEMRNFSMPSSQHLLKLLSKTDFFVFAAFSENRVVGALTAYVLEQYYAERPLAYIYDLGVAIHFQRQGIGKRLIAEMNSFCQESGFEEVFVQAEQEDEHAVEFYRSTKPTKEELAIHFSYMLDKKK
ncbi:aminoglycoside 3-N-acetyltransferase I [Catalinimonas alkaloidigena]|uniref:GNAT family N-acetyltransferase n=1 Tax=Catalinimonas alkaloidigena TaxID=1075417 RepID=UPI00240668F7|nr:GNAT family N-acetyltransferase [Catalinimonas alkaloidigena]MDF9798003.1 aminoglycoside 3-N-acetyltransferase I [Catalinimonas alkaloidigena]